MYSPAAVPPKSGPSTSSPLYGKSRKAGPWIDLASPRMRWRTCRRAARRSRPRSPSASTTEFSARYADSPPDCFPFEQLQRSRTELPIGLTAPCTCVVSSDPTRRIQNNDWCRHLDMFFHLQDPHSLGGSFRRSSPADVGRTAKETDRAKPSTPSVSKTECSRAQDTHSRLSRGQRPALGLKPTAAGIPAPPSGPGGDRWGRSTHRQ